MKASKFSDAQKAFILKQGHEGVAVSEICRRAGRGFRQQISSRVPEPALVHEP